MVHIIVTMVLSLLSALLVGGLINCFSRGETIFYDDSEYFDQEFMLSDGGWIVDETHQRGGLYRSRA